MYSIHIDDRCVIRERRLRMHTLRYWYFKYYYFRFSYLLNGEDPCIVTYLTYYMHVMYVLVCGGFLNNGYFVDNNNNCSNNLT